MSQGLSGRAHPFFASWRYRQFPQIQALRDPPGRRGTKALQTSSLPPDQALCDVLRRNVSRTLLASAATVKGLAISSTPGVQYAVLHDYIARIPGREEDREPGNGYVPGPRAGGHSCRQAVPHPRIAPTRSAPRARSAMRKGHRAPRSRYSPVREVRGLCRPGRPHCPQRRRSALFAHSAGLDWA